VAYCGPGSLSRSARSRSIIGAVFREEAWLKVRAYSDYDLGIICEPRVIRATLQVVTNMEASIFELAILVQIGIKIPNHFRSSIRHNTDRSRSGIEYYFSDVNTAKDWRGTSIAQKVSSVRRPIRTVESITFDQSGSAASSPKPADVVGIRLLRSVESVRWE